MKKLLILALTSAFVAAANADNPNQFGVASTGLSNAEWKQNNQTVSRSYESGVISVDEEASVPLVLSPTTAFTAPDPQVKTVVTIEATFTAISDVDSLGSPGNDAKTALTVAKDSNDTPHYYYWNPLSSDEKKWTLLGTTATPNTEQAVTVVIELDYTLVNSPKAKFKIGNTTPVEVDLSSETTLTGLAFAGTGDLTSVAATVTPAYATKAVNDVTTRYATVADAVNATGDGAVTLYKHNGAFGTMPTVADKLYFPVNVNDNYGTASLYSFTKVDGDYQITSAADLIALKDAVANVPAARSLSYKQTANIDMASAGAFAGIGTDSKQFSGVYDGNDKTISNVTFTPRTYSGVFNSVNNATIKNLTVDTVGFANDADGEYGGAAIVGKIAGTSTLTNLVAKGSVGLEKPFTHNAAGVAVRVTGGNVTIVDCHNEAAVYGAYSKLAGIINLVQADSGSVVITNCSNSGAITASGEFVNDNKTRKAGDNCVAGILSYANMPTTITACSNSGELRGPSGDGGAKIGQIVGWVQGKTLIDGGCNCASSAQGMIGHRAGGTVTGFQYAKVDNSGATTIDTKVGLEKNTTYLLEGNVEASETPVFTLAAAGDTIAFDTSLGYAFAGTVAVAQGLKLNDPSTSGTVKTYTARALETHTVTVNGGANATAAWTVNGVAVATAPATLTEGDTYSVTYTANSGYEFADGATTSASGTAGTEDIVITISDAVAKAQQPEVVSEAKTTLVSVPKDCYAAELIDLSNRAEGDVLKAYNATTERYHTWVLVKVESDLAWEVGKVFVTSADESTAESNKESADTYQLKAGQAVWLTRENPNATIKLAVAADGPVKVDVGIGYNLVAPPPAAEAYDATSLKVAEEGSFDDGDQIVVPTAAAPLSYTRKDGKWKVLSGEAITTGLPDGWGAVADPTWTEPKKIEIPSGQGFWFNSKKAKKLEF